MDDDGSKVSNCGGSSFDVFFLGDAVLFFVDPGGGLVADLFSPLFTRELLEDTIDRESGSVSEQLLFLDDGKQSSFLFFGLVLPDLLNIT